MDGGAGGDQSEPFDFVPQDELLSLEFDNAHVVSREMVQSLMQFVFEVTVFPFQFNEMRLNRHKKSPSFVNLRFSTWVDKCTRLLAAVDKDRKRAFHISAYVK
jgi:hypothetical protein